MKLRYAGTCRSCSTGIPAGVKASYDAATKAVVCTACTESATAETADAPLPPEIVPAETPSAPVLQKVSGAAGASAQAEYERRKQKRETRVRENHPFLGGVILALSDDPHTTTAWAKGAVGERRLGSTLDKLADGDAYVLHDRSVPGSKANIDHIVVASSGIWVIDAKRYKGTVRIEQPGFFSSAKPKLKVGTRDCTKLVDAMSWQVDVIQKVLAKEDSLESIDVHPVLCFVDAEWPLFAGRMELGGVLIEAPKALRKAIARPGPLTPEGVTVVAEALAKHLPGKP